MHFLESLLAILNEMSPYILLGFFIAGLLHAFVKPSLMSRHLAGNDMKSVVKAALLGIPLPLCSCGVLPTAVSLRRSGASRAASTSFLIATPQTGVDSIAATYSLLGPAMAVTRPMAALVCSMLGGGAVARLAPSEPAEITVDEDVVADSCSCSDHGDDHGHRGFWHGFLDALRYGFVDMIQHVGKWLVIGLVVAAAITVFVPDDLFLGLAQYPLLAMIVMVIVAVPMYICATGSIPIALSLMLKGLTPGVAFVLLMAGPAANFASFMVLRKSLGSKATWIYILSVVITAIGFGLLIDYLLPAHWFMPSQALTDACCHTHQFGIFDTICSVALIIMLFNALVVKRFKPKQPLDDNHPVRTFKVSGMMCPHCQATVHDGLSSLPGVEGVEVDLGKSTARVSGDIQPEQIISKIESLGYEALLIQ